MPEKKIETMPTIKLPDISLSAVVSIIVGMIAIAGASIAAVTRLNDIEHKIDDNAKTIRANSEKLNQQSLFSTEQIERDHEQIRIMEVHQEHHRALSEKIDRLSPNP